MINIFINSNMKFTRRPRLRCRILSFEEDDEYMDNQKQSMFHDTISNIMNWDNFDHYKDCDENFACFITNKKGKILHVNLEWEKLCGFCQNEVQGDGFELLQGKDTDFSVCKDFVSSLHKYGKASMTNINYGKNKKPMKLKICAFKIKYSNSVPHVYDKNQPYFWSYMKKLD